MRAENEPLRLGEPEPKPGSDGLSSGRGSPWDSISSRAAAKLAAVWICWATAGRAIGIASSAGSPGRGASAGARLSSAAARLASGTGAGDAAGGAAGAGGGATGTGDAATGAGGAGGGAAGAGHAGCGAADGAADQAKGGGGAVGAAAGLMTQPIGVFKHSHPSQGALTGAPYPFGTAGHEGGCGCGGALGAVAVVDFASEKSRNTFSMSARSSLPPLVVGAALSICLASAIPRSIPRS